MIGGFLAFILVTALLIHGIIWINTNEEGKRMRRYLSVLLAVCLCCGLLMGCGGSKKFSLGKPYAIKTADWECTVTVNGAERTNLLSIFSKEQAKTAEIVYLNVDINLTKGDIGDMVSSFDVWTFIRVSDENGNEIKPFEYALPGDETSVIILESGENNGCTVPYEIEKGKRYIEVDMYQDTEYSNKIKVNID